MELSNYKYLSKAGAHTQSYLLPTVVKMLSQYGQGGEQRVFELGCGNGANAHEIAKLGYAITGVDPSAAGSKIASARDIDLHQGSTEEDLAEKYGTFLMVLSLEVAEHVFSPRLFAERIFDLLEPGGVAIISTPYHGYLKNLALAITGKMDGHFTALWEGGHIKFFSRETIGTLFRRAGMEEVGFERVGRIPQLAKSMICVYRKPE